MPGDELPAPGSGLSERDWLRQADVGTIEGALRPRLVAAYGAWHRTEGSSHSPEDWYRILIDALRQEAKSIDEMVSLSAFALSVASCAPTDSAKMALQDEWAAPVLARFLETLYDAALETPESAKDYLQSLRHHFRDGAGIRGRRVMFPLRSALTGTLRGPCLGVVTSLLGASRCRSRVEEVLTCIPVS